MKRGEAWLAVGLGALAGCEGEPPEKTPLLAVTFASGERLRANVIVAPDGTEHFVDFHDQDLDLDCSFQVTTSGYRCVPVASPALALGYSDEGCTQAVGMLDTVPCLTDTGFLFARGDQASCIHTAEAPISIVYRAGDTRSDVQPFQGVPGACSFAFVGDGAYRELEEIPLDRFAAAEERTAAASGGVATRMLFSADGASVAVGLVDDARQQGCVAVGFGSEAKPCLPAGTRLLRDATIRASDCEGPLAALVDRDCAAPELLVDATSTCPTSLQVFAAGEPVAAAFRVTDAVCDALATDTGLVLATPVAEPVDVSEFPSVRTRTIGSGRVTSREAASDSGVPLRVPLAAGSETRFFDEQLGLACTPLFDEDGVLRCMSGPMLTPSNNAFADASCEKPVVLLPACAGGAPPFGFYASCGIGPVTGAFGIGAPALEVYAKIDDGCFAVGAIANAFVVTGDRDLDELPRLEARRY